LEPEQDICPVVISGGGPELIAEIQKENPDVVLIETTPDFDWLTLCELKRMCPDTKVVLWVQSISVELAHSTKALGVRGILRKDSPTELLVRCLRNVSEGEVWFEKALLDSLLWGKTVRLSPREGQLLRLVSQGLSNKEVAFRLGIAEGTVKVYFSKLFRKVGVSDRYELALYGLRNLVPGVGEAPNHTSKGERPAGLLLLRNQVHQSEGRPAHREPVRALTTRFVLTPGAKGDLVTNSPEQAKHG
jgi:DNA-binding NarL/FixJ family response regulator